MALVLPSFLSQIIFRPSGKTISVSNVPACSLSRYGNFKKISEQLSLRLFKEGVGKVAMPIVKVFERVTGVFGSYSPIGKNIVISDTSTAL
ncbi:hypothetical protein Avbf_10914 [Armadillidium vulgare]|nr:hypothetical protein Avbf_10914 [Armadillidium vulgare]